MHNLTSVKRWNLYLALCLVVTITEPLAPRRQS
jgi:hypothetical protein